MASKKAGRLAGLAALAGLAYMANKKGETKDTTKSDSKSKSYDRDTDTGVDAMASDAAKKPAVDLGEIRDEAGTLSKFRRNTETGEMYDPIGTSSGKSAAAKVAAPAKTSSAPVAKAPAPPSICGAAALNPKPVNPAKPTSCSTCPAGGGVLKNLDGAGAITTARPGNTSVPGLAGGGDR